MRSLRISAITLFLTIGAVVAVSLWAEPLVYFGEQVQAAGLVGYALFVALLVLATVAAPLTALPLIPLAAQLFGPFVTSILSIVGWTIGALIAFCISRYIGRPLVSMSDTLAAAERYIAAIPQDRRLLYLVIMRMVVPVDIASYALGLVRSISIREYVVSTIIGVSYFSFAFAYLGASFERGDWLLFGCIGLVSAVLFYACWAILTRRIKHTSH